jgi:hypothetical protein
MSYGDTPVVVNFATSGAHTIMTPQNQWGVYQVMLVFGGACNVTFKQGTTATSGPMPVVANGSIVLDASPVPWVVGAAGAIFDINTSAAVQVSGTIWWGPA